jgi:hypothetical protein
LARLAYGEEARLATGDAKDDRPPGSRPGQGAQYWRGWRDQFKEVGGFREDLNVRENSELIARLGRFGPYRFVAGGAAVTSMRRYE